MELLSGNIGMLYQQLLKLLFYFFSWTITCTVYKHFSAKKLLVKIEEFCSVREVRQPCTDIGMSHLVSCCRTRWQTFFGAV